MGHKIWQDKKWRIPYSNCNSVNFQSRSSQGLLSESVHNQFQLSSILQKREINS